MEQASLDVHKVSRDIAINLEISQEDVMSYIHEVESQGIIEVDDGTITIADKAALQALAEMAGDSHGEAQRTG